MIAFKWLLKLSFLCKLTSHINFYKPEFNAILSQNYSSTKGFYCYLIYIYYTILIFFFLQIPKRCRTPMMWLFLKQKFYNRWRPLYDKKKAKHKSVILGGMAFPWDIELFYRRCLKDKLNLRPCSGSRRMNTEDII